MENSRRNFVIIVVIVIVGCFCISAVGLGLFGYLIPFERVISFLPTDESVVITQETAAAGPTEAQPDPTATSPGDLPSPTTLATEVAPAVTTPEA